MILVIRFVRGFFELSLELPFPFTKQEFLDFCSRNSVPDAAEVFVKFKESA